MKTKNFITPVLAFSLILCLAACSDDEKRETGVLDLGLFTSLDGGAFAIGTTYQNFFDQDYKVTALSYEITSIRLQRADGSFTENYAPEGYIILINMGTQSTIELGEPPSSEAFVAMEIVYGDLNLAGTSPSSPLEDDIITFEKTGETHSVTKLFEFEEPLIVDKYTNATLRVMLNVSKITSGVINYNFTETPECTEGECLTDLTFNTQAAFELMDWIYVD